MRGLGRFYEIEVVCEGEADPVSGYLVDIKNVDHAVRGAAVPLIVAACEQRPLAEPALLLPELVDALVPALAQRTDARTDPDSREGAGRGVRSVCWRLTPYYCVQMETRDRNTVLLRQRFDFAASHRLHVPGLSDEENRALFGKCNNPGGHGHNYQFEPCVAVRVRQSQDRPPPDPLALRPLTVAQLERIAQRAIIDRFDHKHLNQDTPELFSPEAGGVNPSVENIARIFYGLLAAELAREAPDAELRSITVWETDRTCATYPA